jgi:DNA-binding NtrC family response regulator
VTESPDAPAERTLILAPFGRDAPLAGSILTEAGIRCMTCRDLSQFVQELARGADVAVVTEEAILGNDLRGLSAWITAQPPWSDFPFILLTGHGGGPERNPAAAELMRLLGNVTFLERPFHPTTLISVVETGLRGRRRQYECQRLNEQLELHVEERTAELAAANR